MRRPSLGWPARVADILAGVIPFSYTRQNQPGVYRPQPPVRCESLDFCTLRFGGGEPTIVEATVKGAVARTPARSPVAGGGYFIALVMSTTGCWPEVETRRIALAFGSSALRSADRIVWSSYVFQ